MKIYGHPWSIYTRKTLMTLAEKGQKAEFVLVMIPKGEQKSPEHVARHPFGKVPLLVDDDFVLYETRAINAYLDRRLSGRGLVPSRPRAAARLEQWMNVADSYFAPHAHSLIVESLFRRYLGGEKNEAAVKAGRAGIEYPLDVLDGWLATSPFLAGDEFSLADIHWMPYVEYLSQIGEGEPIARRKHVAAWWERVSARPAWIEVARTGPQPYEPGMTADVVEKLYRRQPVESAADSR
jgi:glutathione S-transferase